MRVAGTAQVETQASVYWRQRVLAVEGVGAEALSRGQHKLPNKREAGHGPALYITLSPIGQACLDDLRRTSRQL